MPDDDPSMSQPRRTLAAIVITDVAGFSSLTQKDEDRTLRLVKRDLDAIRSACEKFQGKVLKSTGDGLLMTFDSAVQAVACTLEVQRAMAAQAKKLPADEVLMHRIGIHLGDVFFSESDVMGDGVNVAARLQDQADPGGICISQTVYDVVKNRLAITATYLGPRELKNIQEAVPVYQIILDAAKGAAGRTKPLSLNARLLIGGGGLAALGALVVLTFLIWRAVSHTPEKAADIAGAAASAPVAEKIEGPESQVDAARKWFASEYNFVGMLKFLEEKGLKDTPLYARYQRLNAMKAFVLARVAAADESNSIRVVMRHGNRVLALWQGPSGRICIKGAEGVHETDFQGIPPALMVNVIRACGYPKPGVIRDFIEEIAFNLPESERPRFADEHE